MFIDYYYIDRKLGIFSKNGNKFHCPGQLGEKLNSKNMAKLADLLMYFIGELPGIILYTANTVHLSERQCHPIFGPSFLPSHADR